MIRNLKKYCSFASAILSIALLIVACSNNKFKLKGEIYGGEDKSIAVEKSDFQGRWVTIDSIRTNRNGGFSFSFPAPPSPDIYRLNLNGQYIYFPVDSTETITLTTSYDKFGRDFILGGSHNAERLGDFEKNLQSVNTANPDSLTAFKKTVYSTYMKDAPGSILNFYILTKTIDNKPLYDPSDPTDRKYFGAVATGYKATSPDDPRTALLEQTAIQALRNKNNLEGKFKTVDAQEISLIDINLQDENGQQVKLSDVAGKGKKVAVIFSLLNAPESPEFNIALANIYNRHAGKVEFYNVSLDADQYAWRDAARNLPWITVYSPGQNSSEDALRYNVFQIPSFYIYNAEGELSSRPLTMEELNKSL